MARAVISTIGSDQPGVVAGLSTLAQRHDLNIEDSRMTVLGGEFAVLMAVEGDDDNLDAFESALANLTEQGLSYIFKRTEERKLRPSRPYRATLSALDHPGIVASIAQFFSEREINIRDLTTETVPAPHTGTPIFNVELVVDVAAETRIHGLKQDFEEFCVEADLDGELEADR